MERPIRLPRPPGCKFDEEAAQRAVDFFNKHCRHTKGRKWYGELFNLRPFQEVDIREVYGRVDDDGNRLIRQYIKFIPKKNGKSEEAAGHALKLTFADDEPGAEVYCAAADRDQSAIVFDVAASMVRMDPQLLRAAGGLRGIINSRKRIVNPGYESFYRALSSEVAGKHGYNSHGVVIDELHALPDKRLWEVLTFGAGDARDQPLTVGISTAGIPGESPVAEELWDYADQMLRGVIPQSPSFYPVIYAAPDDADWTDEEVWRSCNPALGDFLRIDAIRDACERAKRIHSDQNAFRRLRLNQWTKQEVRWVDMADWDKGGVFTDVKSYENWRTNEIRELKHLPWYLGIDLSTKLDLTALVAVCRDGFGQLHWLPWFWIPGDNMADRPNVESEKYRQWERQGLITATPGAAVSFDAVRGKIKELSKVLNIREIPYDPRFAEHLRQDLEADGHVCVECPQGFKLSEACIETEALVSSGQVLHGGHPVLRWNIDCATTKQNLDGAVRPVKPERLRSGKRIDGWVAGLMGTLRSLVTGGEVASVYADPEAVV